ncbi:MAG: sugar ABC transporter permease [Gemmatimonadetes bacterium]|nr:MAG: sugar ABC transporter permease [Gemmatimonadota bacterium]
MKFRVPDKLLPYIYVGPAYLYMAFFLLIPSLLAVKLSFSAPFTEGVFPTLDTWKWVLIEDGQRFWKSARLTTYYVLTTITIQTVLGLFIAILLNMKFKGRGVLRTIVILPMSIPLLVSAIGIVTMFGNMGTLNGLITDTLGWVDKDIPYMTTTIPIIYAEVWKNTPLAVLVILAGLEGIPDSVYEAARTMGANKWQQFWRITLPLAWPSVFVAFILRLAEAFKMFAFPVLVGTGTMGDVLSKLSWDEHNRAANAMRPESISSAYGLSMVMLALGFVMLVGAMYISYHWVRKRAQGGLTHAK